MSTSNAPEITIILPVHNERASVGALIEELEKMLEGLGRPFEILTIDDGSTDGSDELLRGIAVNNSFLKVITFRQNYGQSAAFDAGFRHARGQIVVTLDADGQNDPADIPRMIEMVEKEGYDFIAGNRADRQDGWLLRRLPSQLANWVIRRVTGTRVRDLGCSLKVYRRELTDELRLYGEMHRFIAVLVENLGARSTDVNVNHRPRVAGRSKYGIGRTVKVVLDLITVWFMNGYQTKPIYIFGGIGLSLGFLSVLLAGFVLYQKLGVGVWVHRNPLFILAAVMGVIAVQFMCLGLIAEILVRTYFESQQKPSYLISKRIPHEMTVKQGASPGATSRRVALEVTVFGTSAKPAGQPAISHKRA